MSAETIVIVPSFLTVYQMKVKTFLKKKNTMLMLLTGKSLHSRRRKSFRQPIFPALTVLEIWSLLELQQDELEYFLEVSFNCITCQ